MSSVLSAERSYGGFAKSEEASAHADTAKTIADLINKDGIFVDGNWIETKDQDPQGDVRLIQLADVGDGTYRNRSARFLTSAKARELGCTFLKAGDLLIARMPDPLGRACIFPGDEKPSVTVVDVCIVRTGEDGTNHRWLMHRINSADVRAAIAALQSGSTRKRISRSNLARIRFDIPQLDQQEQIVAEIEKQFTRLDAGVASLKRVQAALKRYRASVLKAACEGRLVPTEAELAHKENRSYETGEQLLHRILKERREKWHGKGKYKGAALADDDSLRALPEGWASATLDALAEIKGGITKDQKRKHSAPSREVPYLRVANVQRGYLDLSEVKEIAATEEEIDELKLVTGDVLFNEGGDRDKLGRGWVWDNELPECIHQNHIFRARLHSKVAPKFISYYANSFGQRFFFAQGKHTTNLASISMTKLKQLPVPIPPAVEQERIVEEIERRFSLIGELETITSTDLQRGVRLRQSILQNAFEP